MIDATKLPTEPCDPNKVADVQVDAAKAEEPQYVRAPEGNGHESAVRQQGGAR